MSCEKCKGTGFILYEKDGVEYARYCDCRQVDQAKTMLEKSGISEEFKKKGFKDYDDRGKETLKKAKQMALSYCKEFQEIKNTRYNSALFMGQVGSGKTHLSMAICNNIMEFYKVGVVYMPYREEIIKIKQCVTDDLAYEQAINKFKLAPVLMIDDMLKGKSTEADVNILFEIVNYRYLNNMPMIISTEKTMNELLDFDEGTMSRIIEMARGHLVEIKGAEFNYRLI